MARAQKSNGRTARMDTKTQKFRGKGNKSRGRSGANNKDRNYTRDTNNDYVDSPTNDPVWYAQTPELMQLSANIPFSQAAGTTFNLDVFNDEEEGSANYAVSSNMTVPGLIIARIIPVPSSASGPNSPLNIAATSVFSYVRHANSGTPQYDSPDLMIYMIAMGQVYSYINWLQRVYGCMNIYANMNRYLPRTLVESQGVDYNSVLVNLPNFKYGIDSLIHKAASLAVPGAMTYFNRLAFMFSGIYAEGESVKDQLYMYAPQGFMQFSETASDTGGSLTYLPLWVPGQTLLTYQKLIDYGNSLLDPIIASQDMNIMSGDILKAYGDAGIIKLNMLPDFYMVTPTTDLTVLEQFQNSTAFTNGQYSPVSCTITQSQTGRQGYLVSNVMFAYDPAIMAAVNGDKVLTTILTAPTAADVMERTRLMAYGVQSDVDDTTKYIKVEMATEVVTGYDYYKMDPATHTAQRTVCSTVFRSNANGTLAAMWNIVLQHCDMENFKFHPIMYYFDNLISSTSAMKLDGLALDFDNYAIINTRDLQRMNEAALLSMFNVNSVAKAY